MKISRSKLFATAISEFIARHKNRQLLTQINAAYDDAPDPYERDQLQAMKIKQLNGSPDWRGDVRTKLDPSQSADY